MIRVYRAEKSKIGILKSFADNQKYLLHSARDFAVDDRHFIFYAMEYDSIVGYTILSLVHPQDVRRKHTAVVAVVVDPEKDSVVVPLLLEQIYQIAKDLDIEKIYTYEVSEKDYIIDNLTKAGFFEEAEMKKFAFFNGEYYDVSIWSKFVR